LTLGTSVSLYTLVCKALTGSLSVFIRSACPNNASPMNYSFHWCFILTHSFFEVRMFSYLCGWAELQTDDPAHRNFTSHVYQELGSSSVGELEPVVCLGQRLRLSSINPSPPSAQRTGTRQQQQQQQPEKRGSKQPPETVTSAQTDTRPRSRSTNAGTTGWPQKVAQV